MKNKILIVGNKDGFISSNQETAYKYNYQVKSSSSYLILFSIAIKVHSVPELEQMWNESRFYKWHLLRTEYR